jgi:hypothetical protein
VVATEATAFEEHAVFHFDRAPISDSLQVALFSSALLRGNSLMALDGGYVCFVLRFAAFAPSFPSAVRVRFGSFAIVRFFFAARAAFLMFRRAAARCFEDAIANAPSKFVGRLTPIRQRFYPAF